MIYCKLPNAGLGNQLFVIAKALYFSNNNKVDIRFIDSQKLKLGPIIRGERTKRNYNGFFNFQKGYFCEFVKKFYFAYQLRQIKIVDPFMECVITDDVLFLNIPHYSEYFAEMIPHRITIRELLFDSLTPKIQRSIERLECIDVAVHVRLGDFKKLKQGVDFKNVGSTRTPLSYYITEIKRIQYEYPEYLFYVFSDGYPEELKVLLGLKNVVYYKSINDIVDLYQMSKSKILITSAGSTYSYWAGFLGDAKIVQHPNHYCKIR